MSVNQQPFAMITGGNSGMDLPLPPNSRPKAFTSSWRRATNRPAHRPSHGYTPAIRMPACDSIRSTLHRSHRYANCSCVSGQGLSAARPDQQRWRVNRGKQARFTTDGFEMTLGTNHLGHFLFTNLLLDDLKRSAPARVITVSSQLHIPGYAGGKPPDFDYDNLKGEKYYDANVFYRNSKLANMWFTYELQRRLTGTGVTSNAVCPGFVPAAIADRRTSPIDRFMYKQVLARMPFARSLEQASASYMVAATDPSLEGVGGKFIVDGKERRSSDDSYDEAKARRLWDLSWAWCGLL